MELINKIVSVIGSTKSFTKTITSKDLIICFGLSATATLINGMVHGLFNRAEVVPIESLLENAVNIVNHCLQTSQVYEYNPEDATNMLQLSESVRYNNKLCKILSTPQIIYNLLISLRSQSYVWNQWMLSKSPLTDRQVYDYYDTLTDSCIMKYISDILYDSMVYCEDMQSFPFYVVETILREKNIVPYPIQFRLMECISNLVDKRKDSIPYVINSKVFQMMHKLISDDDVTGDSERYYLVRCGMYDIGTYLTYYKESVDFKQEDIDVALKYQPSLFCILPHDFRESFDYMMVDYFVNGVAYYKGWMNGPAYLHYLFLMQIVDFIPVFKWTYGNTNTTTSNIISSSLVSSIYLSSYYMSCRSSIKPLVTTMTISTLIYILDVMKKYSQHQSFLKGHHFKQFKLFFQPNNDKSSFNFNFNNLNKVLH